jgi:GDP-4-dehydro-6-deoxy-D-mannose reductase
MSAILVTGGTGFAGRHLLQRLDGSAPVVAWRRPRSTPPDNTPGVEWHDVDLLDKNGVANALARSRPRSIYHVAGMSRLDTAWDNVVPHLHTNVLGTHYLLEGARASGLETRVLVVTSAQVYATQHSPIDEQTPLVPTNPYGRSKLAQDLLALRAAKDDGMDVVVARPFNHIGPQQQPAFALPSFARQIALIEAGRAEPVLRVGNLDARRDLVDVRDVADAYVRLMAHGVSGRAYNICSGRAVRIGDALDHLLTLSRAPVRLAVDETLLRPSDTPEIIGSAQRLKEETGWAPRYDLADTLRDLLDSWRAQILNDFR